MNRTHRHGDLPDPVQRYWMDLRHVDPPTDLLDEVVADIEKAPRPLWFSFVPVAGLLAAASVAIAVLTLNLWPTPPHPVGTDESARASSPSPSASSSAALPPGVVPIRDDPPRSTVPVLEADITEWNVDVTGWPTLTAHGSVWFGNSETGQLTRVDADTGEVSDVIDVNPNPSTPDWDQLASADDRWVYASGLDETIVQIDPSTNEIVRRIPIGTVPYRMEIYDGDAYITDLDRGHVTRVDLEAGEVVWQARHGFRPSGLEVTEGAVWVAIYGEARMLRLDPATGEALEEYPIYVFGMDILYDGEGALFIMGNQDRPLERFSIAQGRVTDRIAAMGAVFHDGDLYGLHREGYLVRLDPATLQWLALVEVAPGVPNHELSVGEGEGAVWLSAGTRLWKVDPAP